MAAAALVNAPSTDWTEDDGLHKRVEQFTRTVEDMMLGPLSTYKEPSKTRTLICWLPESIKELVWEAGILKHNDYKKVTEFLLDWAKPKNKCVQWLQNTKRLNPRIHELWTVWSQNKEDCKRLWHWRYRSWESFHMEFHSDWTKLSGSIQTMCWSRTQCKAKENLRNLQKWCCSACPLWI